ncbi:uncharacterized protein LOC144142367 isoform X2 [Haemaphysalis longicornis]
MPGGVSVRRALLRTRAVQAGIATSNKGLQCALRFCSSAACQTFPGMAEEGAAGWSSREAHNESRRRRRQLRAESDHPADRARRALELAKQRERNRLRKAAETPQQREARLATNRKGYHARQRAKLAVVQRGGDAAAD